MRRLLQRIRVSQSLPGRDRSNGFILAGPLRINCILGRSGVVVRKREGDGGSPRGTFVISGGYFRADRTQRLRTAIRLRGTRTTDGWCDDPASFNYNRPVRLPARFRCERMALIDGVYDVVLTTNHNSRPRILGAGSAIFVHLRRPDGAPTEGCIALSSSDMRRLLPRLAKRTRIVIV